MRLARNKRTQKYREFVQSYKETYIGTNVLCVLLTRRLLTESSSLRPGLCNKKPYKKSKS